MEQDRFQELVLSELSDIKDRIAGIENRLTAVETKLDERGKKLSQIRNDSLRKNTTTLANDIKTQYYIFVDFYRFSFFIFFSER